MKNHVLRPLFVVIGIVVLILLIRAVYVPKDFGVHERGYMYGWYRKSNEEEWKKFKVKYQGAEYCKECHSDKHDALKGTPHRNIECENCHGPAVDHPSDPPKLVINKSRTECLRCHFPLPYPTSHRSRIRGIDPEKHNPNIECSSCHNPHKPMEGLR